MAESIATRVARGAALLDRKRPGWAKRIKVARLDVRSCKHCIITQLFGQFYKGINSLWPSTLVPPTPADCGFATRDLDSEDWEALTDAWRCAIRERLAPPAPKQAPVFAPRERELVNV